MQNYAAPIKDIRVAATLIDNGIVTKAQSNGLSVNLVIIKHSNGHEKTLRTSFKIHKMDKERRKSKSMKDYGRDTVLPREHTWILE
jgi:hypothetical protein